MDEEEELENTLIGQEEAPGINTEDARIGSGPVNQQVSVGGEQTQTTVPVEEPGFFDSRLGSAITGILSGAEQARRADAFTRSLAPAAQSGIVDYAISPDRPSLTESIQENLPDPSSFGLELPQTGSVPNVLANQGVMAEPAVAPTLPSAASQFLTPNPLVLPSETLGQIPSVNPFSLESAEQVNPISQAVNEIPILGATQGQEATALPLNQTLSQFMRNEDAPEQRTEQFVDPQGRLRRRLTPEASALQGFAPGVQPLAPEYTDFERESLARQIRSGGTGSFAGDSAALQARIAERDRLPGETQTERDTRIAQSRTTGGQTEGLSFDDARRRAEGQLAARGIINPPASQVNALARSIQAAEPERLAKLETKRAKDAAELRDAEAKKDFKPQVVEIGGQKLIQLSPNYYQPVRPEPTAEEPFVPRVLEEGGFTYYEVAPNRFERQPKDTASTTEETSGLIDMDGEASVATETTPTVPNDIKDYPSVEAAEAANLAPGTRITVQGKPAIIE